MKRYIVMEATAAMPSSCWGRGRYRKLAVVELEPGRDTPPAMISTRARGVRRIVEVWDRVHRGATRGAYYEARAAADGLAAALNGE